MIILIVVVQWLKFLSLHNGCMRDLIISILWLLNSFHDTLFFLIIRDSFRLGLFTFVGGTQMSFTCLTLCRETLFLVCVFFFSYILHAIVFELHCTYQFKFVCCLFSLGISYLDLTCI